MKKKAILGIILAVILVFVMFFIPGSEKLSDAGIRTIGLMLAFIVTLICEVTSPALLALIFLSLAPIMGVTPSFAGTLAGFANPVPWFVLAYSGIAMAFTGTPLAKRLAHGLIKRFSKSPEQILFAIMCCGTILSAIMSNIPVTIFLAALSEEFLSVYDNEKDRASAAKAFMIGVPVSAFLGGICTPIGSSINLMVFNFMATNANVPAFTFVQWTLVALPIGFIMTPIAWFFLKTAFKLPEVKQTNLDGFIDGIKTAVPNRMGGKEMFVGLVMLLMLLIMVASSWIKGIDIYAVCMLTCCIFLLPKIGVVKWKDFIKNASWDAVLLAAVIISLGSALSSNGVSAWLSSLLPANLGLSLPLLLALLGLIQFLLLIVLPVAPSVAALMAVPLAALAASTGFAPQALFATCAICCGQAYLFPFDTISLLTYSKGYYGALEMPKATVGMQACVIILMAIWIPIACRILGF